MTISKLCLGGLCGLLMAGPAGAAKITVFEQGAAVATEMRTVDLKAGVQSYGWPGLPNALLPDTLLLKADGVELLGSRFLRDALGQYGLLSQSIGEKVTLLREDGAGGDVSREATVISANGPLVLSNGRYEVIDASSPWRIAWSALPAGQPPTPGLTLELESEAAGNKDLALTYQTNGLSWSADYVGRYDESSESLQLRAQAGIRNEAGNFVDAELTLVSGQIARASGGGRPPVMMRAMAADESAAGKMSAAPSFEYYRYELEEPISLVSGESRNVTLFSEQEVAVERSYVIEGGWRSGNGDLPTANPEIRLDFENSLERPLPAGSVRIYDSTEPPMLLGEDSIRHTAESGPVRLTLGRAFDISAERRVTDENREGKARESSRRITVSNAKDKSVQVRVIESLPGDWEITSQNLPHERVDAHRVVWVVGVPAGGKASLVYQVKWR